MNVQNNLSMDMTHNAILQSINGQSKPSLVSGNPAVMPIRKLEEYEDSLRGKSFRGKAFDNFGMIEVVDFSFEDSGKMFVSFKNGHSMPLEELTQNYEPINFTPNTNINIAAGLEVDGELPKPQRNKIISNQNTQQKNNNRQPSQPETSQRKRREEFDPIFELLKKMKIPDIDFDLKIKLSIPKKEVFEPLNQSFDNFDEKIVDFIFLEDNIDKFKFALRQSIRAYYGLEELPYIPKESEIEKKPLVETSEDIPPEEYNEEEVDDDIILPNPYEISEEDFLQLKELEKNLPKLTPEISA